jgi:hypothetical protein
MDFFVWQTFNCITREKEVTEDALESTDMHGLIKQSYSDTMSRLVCFQFIIIVVYFPCMILTFKQILPVILKDYIY